MLAAAALSLVAGPAKADPAEIQIVTQSFAPLQWDNAGKRTLCHCLHARS